MDVSMGKTEARRLFREDRPKGVLSLCDQGVGVVKVVPSARMMGVTTGSFHWQLSNHREDAAIVTARRFSVKLADHSLAVMADETE